MNDPKAPKKFSDLSPDEKIDILLQEREMNQGGDQGLIDQINIELTMAFDEKDFEEQYFNENFIQEMSFASTLPDKEIEKPEEAPTPIKEDNSANATFPHHAVRQVDDIHKALLGSINPKEQSSKERIEQKKARKLAEGAIKLRRGN